MADAAPKSEGRKGARKHTGLGRGPVSYTHLTLPTTERV